MIQASCLAGCVEAEMAKLFVSLDVPIGGDPRYISNQTNGESRHLILADPLPKDRFHGSGIDLQRGRAP